MTRPSCGAFGNLRMMTDLKISSLQTKAFITLGMPKGLALQGLK